MESKHLIKAGEESADQNIRIVLVGKTGAGKSATGNTILQKKAFESKPSLSSMTVKCQKETGEFEGQHLAVVDTPGLFDTEKPEKEVVAELGRCISMSAPGPHVFLVVIQPNRFTEEEQKTVQLIQTIFEEKASDYTMVLFTHGDDLEADETSIEKLIETSEKVSSFISQCGGGYHLFNNRSKDPSQVRELLKKINAMIEKNGGEPYTNEMFQEAKRAIEKEMIFILKENPYMEVNEARRRAEHDNSFIQSLINLTAKGAVVGAACGVLLGPLGVVLGATLGASVGGLISSVRTLTEVNPNACVLQ